jgi:glyoxylase-like metal-dependent hydrolase (beta-lactamase superfamily II)
MSTSTHHTRASNNQRSAGPAGIGLHRTACPLNRATQWVGFFALVVYCSTFATLGAEQDFSKVEIKVTRISGTVYMLEGSGGNIGASVGDDGIVIVDDQFAPLAPKIRKALQAISDKPLKFVLNTHFHGDHSGGNVPFGKEATIIAHENVRKRLQDAPAAGPDVKGGLPVITFNERASVYVNGEEIRAIHFPHGHTDGASVIFFKQANVVHMGDDFVTYGFPFVDTKSGGTVSGLIAGVEKVPAMVPSDAKIIPGHGPLSTTGDMRQFVDMLKETRSLVADALKAGKTAQQMKDEHLLAAYQEKSKGFIKAESWIDTLYEDVTAK